MHKLKGEAYSVSIILSFPLNTSEQICSNKIIQESQSIVMIPIDTTWYTQNNQNLITIYIVSFIFFEIAMKH